MRRLLLTMLIALLALSCAEENKLLSGTVVDKSYDDPDTWETTECAYRDEDWNCYMYYTAYHHDGAHYKLKIEGTVDGESDSEQEWHSVDEETYDAYDIGDAWVKGSKPCTGDRC